MLRKHRCVTTKTGLVIGCAYVPPAHPEIGSEAEKIQRVLLAKPPVQVVDVGARPIWWRALRAVRNLIPNMEGVR